MVPLLIDHLEQVTVHRLTEEEPLEARRAKRVDELTAGVDDASAERGEIVDVMEDEEWMHNLRYWRGFVSSPPKALRFHGPSEAVPNPTP